MEYINKYYRFIYNGKDCLCEGVIHVKDFSNERNEVVGPAVFFYSPFNSEDNRITLAHDFHLHTTRLADEIDKRKADLILLDGTNRFRSVLIEQ